MQPDNTIKLGATGFADFGFTGAHPQAGPYKLFVKVGTGSFAAFNPNDFSFMVTDAMAPGAIDQFTITTADIPGLVPGQPFIAWTDNTVGTPRPDTILRDFASFAVNIPAIPSAVLIPAGETTATFAIDAIDEFIGDGTRLPDGVRVVSVR